MSILAIAAFTLEEMASGDLTTWSEQKLVACAKLGHRAAFGELCQRHAKQLIRITQRITRNREDAEDALQDSFLSGFVHLRDFDGRSRFATWLTRIAINSALAKLRKKRGIREVPMSEPGPVPGCGDYYQVSDPAPNPEEDYGLRERREFLSQAINKLQPRIRKVVQVHQFQERSLKETAKILGISTTTAKARMFRARTALRRMPLLKSAGESNWASAG
jgi:RNA polymerase sigma-70 factor (ECF subfamily)